MFEIEYAQLSTASADRLWTFYRDVDRWPQWDASISTSSLDGPFTVGSQGSLTPQGSQPVPFVLTHVDEGGGFEDVTELPGAALVFTHHLEAVPGGTRIRHAVRIEGERAAHFAGLFGGHLQSGLPTAVAALAALAEADGTAP